MKLNTKRKLTKQEEKILENAWLGIDIDESKLSNILDVPTQFKEDSNLWYTNIMSNPDYIYFLCNYILNFQPAPFQLAILQEMWNRKFPMLIGSRGVGKTSLMAVYALLRMILMPGRKIVIAGAAFRQSRLVFEYMENIWKESPLLRDMFKDSENGPRRDIDECKFRLGNSILKAIPIGNGEKIRGIRAHDLICDEFSSINREIFETVLAGFGAVSAKPLENVKLMAAIKKAKELNIDIIEESEKEKAIKSNQLVISGTCSYDFEHFAQYWRRWRDIILSRGDVDKLSHYDVAEGDFNWHDYSVIRIPYELIPEGFMDKGYVDRARATSHVSTYMREYGAVFAKDSLGFFKRSLIESCTVSDSMDSRSMPEDADVFVPSLSGDSNKKYVMGIDPASEVDNFSITIVEIHKNHRRIVYVWTTNKKDHIERLQHGLTQENNYYAFCARKIRNLYKRFNIEAIAIDSQGGGKQIVDAMNDKDKMQEGEDFLWPIIEEDKEKHTDNLAGKHIIHLISFANNEWLCDANHGMKKDFEDRAILFPFFDAITLASIQVQDAQGNKIFDTLEDCFFEVEELKNELAIITHTKTTNGRDRWDTPETKLPNGKKGRLRKDRYSSLLMANYIARNLIVRNFESKTSSMPIGGFSTSLSIEDLTGDMYSNTPEWFKNVNYNL